MKILSKNQTIHLRLSCILVIVGVFLVGLYPYDFFPKNEVGWLKERNGIFIKERGIAYSSTMFKNGREPTFPNEEITIEVWLESRIKPKNYLAWIFSLVDRKGNEYVTLAQWSTNLYIVRGQITDPTLPDKRKRMVLSRLFSAGKRRFITVTSGRNGTAVYVNGILKKRDSNVSLNENIGQGPLRFLLGNSPRGDGQWMGNLHCLAIYDRSMGNDEVRSSYQNWIEFGTPSALTVDSQTAVYLFDEHMGSKVKNHGLHQYELIIPSIYRVVQRGFLETERLNIRQNLYNIDTILHFLGFIPVGFLLIALFRRTTRFSLAISIISTILVSVGLGFSIELLQVYLPSRDTQLLDLISNFFGTVAGLTAFGLLSYLRGKKPDNQNIL